MYTDLKHFPPDIEENCDGQIIEDGFTSLADRPGRYPKPRSGNGWASTMFLQSLEFGEADGHGKPGEGRDTGGKTKAGGQAQEKEIRQNFLSVNVNKIDALMDLVGEIVTTESMVIKNPDLSGLCLDSFEKQARHLKKLTDELQGRCDVHPYGARCLPFSTRCSALCGI